MRKPEGIAPLPVSILGPSADLSPAQQARAELREAWNLQREELLSVLLARTDRIYREAMACQNHGAALGALNTCARIAQL